MAETRNFDKDFENALNFLERDGSEYLSVFESVTLNYLQSNASLSLSVYVDFQVHVFELLRENANVLLHYLKRDQKISYNGQFKSVFRRIEKLRKISYYHLKQIDTSINGASKIKGSMFSFQSIHPWEIQMVLLRQDGEFFSVSMDINDSLNLISQLMVNTKEKLQKGNNNIDTELYQELITNFEALKNTMGHTLDTIEKGEEQ